jgi:hypothetical protein
MAGPTDIAAVIVQGGKLVVIDARGTPWKMTGYKKKGPDGKDLPAPDGVETAFKLNDRLVVLSGGTFWTYATADGTWSKGFALEDKPAGEGEEAVWSQGPSIDAKAPLEKAA